MAYFILKKIFLSLILSFSNKHLELLLVLNLPPSPLPPPLLYACIFMDYIETECFKTQYIKPWVWKRFTDNVFFIWTESEENLKRFLKELHGLHPSIRSTFEKSKIKVNFLDVVVKINNGRLSTDLYSKPVERHQYLHYNSCHANINI